jgi:mannose-1-phosphate guanylyltransferase
MERTDRGAVLPLNAGWSDVGSWSALWETAEQDAEGYVLRGLKSTVGAFRQRPSEESVRL